MNSTSFFVHQNVFVVVVADATAAAAAAVVAWLFYSSVLLLEGWLRTITMEMIEVLIT